MSIESPRAVDGWPSLAAGLLWLWAGGRHGGVGFLLALGPGVVLVASGSARIRWPGNPRTLRFVAFGAGVGAVLAVPGSLVFSPAWAAGLLVASCVSFVASGRASLRADPPRAGVPAARWSLEMSARVAIDELVLAGQGLVGTVPRDPELQRIRREVDTARELFARRGWLADPGAYHRPPPRLDDAQLELRRFENRLPRVACEALAFESGYRPDAAEPGGDRWLGYSANHTAHAVILRHPGAPRPWLVCVHGFLMGHTGFGLWLFDAIRHHQRLGLNVALPVLPFHGPRRVGLFSGDGYLDGDVLNTIHAEAQTVWDLRRLLGWIRAQGAPPIGLHGMSLGGYNAAPLAGIEGDLACVIAGIPPSDLAHLVRHHAPRSAMRSIESAGLELEHVAETLRVVSPLAFEPKVPLRGLAIYAGIGDRLVPADHPFALWEHWGRPRIVWMQSGHDPRTREARQLVDETLASAIGARPLSP